MGSMLTIPFARSQPYSNPQYVQAMADLMLQRGQAAQANALLRAQNTQQMYQGLGQTAMATMAQIGNQRDEATNRKMIQAERDRDYAVKQQEMKERAAERRSNELWRQQQYETEQKRYGDTIAQQQADEVGLEARVPEDVFNTTFRGHPAAGRFRTIPGQAAMPAWETEPVGDAMTDAGPATAAVPMAHMRNPNAQEQLALKSAALAEADRAEAARRYTVEQGQEAAREREQRRQFEVTNNRLSAAEGRNPTTASLALAAAKGDVTAQKALDLVRKMDAGGRSPQQVQNFMTLTGQYQKSPLVAAADRTLILGDAIKAVRADPNSAPAQTQLAYSFVQALDTYQSAVREGELKNINLIDSAVGRWGNEIEGIVSQKRLVSAATAKSIADTSERMIKAIEDGRNAKAADFGRRARVAGVGDMWNEYFNPAAPSEQEVDWFNTKIGDGNQTPPAFGPQTPVQPFKFQRPGGQ